MLDSLWTRLLTALEGRIPETAIESWLRPCRVIAMDGDVIRVAAPNKYSRDWLVQHYTETIQSAARTVLGGNPVVSIEIDREPERAPAPVRELPAVPQSNGLSPRYTFESFVIGNSNQFAQAASQAVAELPSKAYNPLFIYGGVGLGKTHLLHAVGHEIARLYPSLRLLYLSTERFTNDLINAIRYDRTAEFRAKYRTIDLLLIDDVQFISGKERLRSRFEWGLIADIQPPDFETRVAILKKKAEIERVRLPDDVAYLIASRIKANIREIEGSLTRMIAFCSLSGREMSVELAQEVLSDLWGEDEKIITIEHIQRKVAEFFGVKLGDMRAKNRTKAVAFPRQIAMYLARQLTHASLAEVGRTFGGKDHTTVLHAVEKIHGMLQDDPKFKKTVDTLTQSITL